MPASTDEVRGFLDSYLSIHKVPDYPNALNGLQVEGRRAVTRVATAVDACQATINRAVEIGAELLIVHHGLFWAGLEPVTGRHAARLRRLLASRTALYSAHLPLDLHPEVGNNVLLAAMMGLQGLEGFGEFEGVTIGVVGAVQVELGTLVGQLENALDTHAHVIAAGPSRTNRVGVISGGAGNMIAAARAAGVDTFVTGEGAHHTHFDAEEWGMNVVYAGHYATETVGVRALGERVAAQFGLACEFIDHPTGL
jgi:dinuclear metal center YbgI/SA1388 family protein